MQFDIFISYSRKDSRIADAVCKALDSHNLTYFIDRKGIAGGMEFPEILANAILNSKIFLFLASENSYKSSYTKNEITFAFNHGCMMLPYIIDGSKLPINLEFTFASINWRTIKVHPIEPVLVNDLLKLCDKSKTHDGASPIKEYNEDCHSLQKTTNNDDYYGITLDGKYKIGYILGSGCTGVVYFGENLTSSKPVAIKRCQIVNSAKRSFRNQGNLIFRDEAEKQLKKQFEANSNISCRFRHLALNPVIGVVKTSHDIFCIMEYISGLNLCKYISAHPLSEKSVVNIIRRISPGVKYLHDHGFLHYDIKPHNIMWDEKSREAKLIDFSTIMNMHERGIENIWFSCAYAAPELRALDKKSYKDQLPIFLAETIDIYALGATMYHLLTNKYPPDSCDAKNLISEVRYNLDILNVSSEVASIVIKAMAVDPNLRYRKMAEFINDIESLVNLKVTPLYPPMTESDFVEREKEQMRSKTTIKMNFYFE